jgi:hypothetical protein
LWTSILPIWLPSSNSPAVNVGLRIECEPHFFIQ